MLDHANLTAMVRHDHRRPGADQRRPQPADPAPVPCQRHPGQRAVAAGGRRPAPPSPGGSRRRRSSTPSKRSAPPTSPRCPPSTPCSAPSPTTSAPTRRRSGSRCAAPRPCRRRADRPFEDRYGIAIVEGYGLSEGTCACTINPLDGPRKPGTVGLPLPGQRSARRRRRQRRPPQGEAGEVIVRGPNVMRGYLNQPEETARALVGAGCTPATSAASTTTATWSWSTGSRT